MEGKLIKKGEELFELFTQGFLKGSTNHDLIDSLNTEEGNVRYKLSLTNCQAIERGYDLDELAEKEYLDGYDTTKLCRTCFKDGFQKALEILGDKKFTEEDVRKAMTHALRQYHYRALYACQDGDHPTIDNFIRSLQQTEWVVEIKTEPCFYDDSLGGFSTSYTEGKPTERPKHDNEGCLILKRKK